MKPLFKTTVCLALALSLALAGCKTSPTANDGSAGHYVQSCLTGAAVGAGAGALYELLKNKGKGQSAGDALKKNSGTLFKVAAAGCVIGIAATAVGKLMDDQQKVKHEEAMQRDAKRRALEQQQYAANEQRIERMPAATPAQKTTRDASLEKARADWQSTYARPVTTDIGNGGTSTIEATPPKDVPAPGQPPACVDYSVLVKTAAGTAKQFETWCPNPDGQMVRAEVRAQPAG